METKVFEYDTTQTSFLDITRDVETVIRSGSGLVNVFAPHATAGIAIIETGSGSEGDLGDAIDRLLPRDDRYRHSHGSPGHGADHVLPAFISPSVTLPVIDGRLSLGTWQSVVLVDTNRDNPRRKVRVSFLGD
jgi:secondary thiamine-phosphate synthase enzyme